MNESLNPSSMYLITIPCKVHSQKSTDSDILFSDKQREEDKLPSFEKAGDYDQRVTLMYNSCPYKKG